MARLNFKRFNKKFLCAAAILLCTVISGVFNPLYRIFDPKPYEVDAIFNTIVLLIHIIMGICSICFFIPAWNAVKCSYNDENDKVFKTCMLSILIIALVWVVIGTLVGSFLIMITFFFFVANAVLLMFSIYVICFVNAMLALKALEILKKQNRI